MATMIPRTSIDEANRHLMALHQRLGQLESTVKDQNEALRAKDEWLKSRLADMETAKNREVAKLSNKLISSEKMVDILQEQLRQKHQQAAILQRSCRLMQNLVAFKSNVKELCQCMEEADKDMASQRDFLSLYTSASPASSNQASPASKSSGIYVTPELVNSYSNHMDSRDEHSLDGIDSADDLWRGRSVKRASREERQDKRTSKEERKGKGKGKEFYL